MASDGGALPRKLGAGFFGGEGFFLTTLSGTGTVLLQSLPFSRLAERVVANSSIASGGGGRQHGRGLAARRHRDTV